MIIHLTNGPVKLSVDLNRGADITSYRDDRIGGEVIWRREPALSISGDSPELNHNTQAFYDSYQGGIQELFPNTADPTTVLGADLPFHGELCRTPLEVTNQSESSVTVTGVLKRYPVRVSRTIEISSEGIVHLATTVTNLSGRQLPYSWALHPVFSEFFTGSGSRVWCKSSGATAHPEPFSSSQAYTPGATVELSAGALGDEIALSEPDSGTADLVYIDVTDNWFQLGRPDDWNIAMRWTNEDFNCVWLWQECHVDADWPWWGQYHVVGVEPHTTSPAATLAEHIDNGRHRILGPHQSREAGYSFELVKGINMEGVG